MSNLTHIAHKKLDYEINYFGEKDEEMILPPVKENSTPQYLFEKLVTAWNLIHQSEHHISLKNRRFEIEKDALAFVVEALRQEDPLHYQATIDHLIERIRKYDKGEFKKHLEEIRETFFEIINSLYEKFLYQRLQCAISTRDAQLEQRILQMAETHLFLRDSQKDLHEFKGAPLQIGGLSRTTLPHWYHRDYICDSPENRLHLIHSY